MNDHVDAFLKYLALNRGCSEHTVRAYRADLVKALQFFRERLGRDPRPDQLNKQLVREYLAAQTAAGYAPTTVARRLAALSSFFLHLRRLGLLASRPTWGLKPPSPGKKLPHVLTRDEVALLLSMPLLSQSPLDVLGVPLVAAPGAAPASMSRAAMRLRDKAILEVLYSTGCRAGELVGLDLADIDLDSGLVKVRGKGKRERIVVLGPPALQALRGWLEVRPSCPDGPAAGAVFLNGSPGNPGRRGQARACFRGRLTTRSLDRLFAVYVERAGLDPRTTPHSLRHSFGAHLLDAGANLRGVQSLLGHKKLSMTGYYCQVSIRHLHEAHLKAHPLAGGQAPAPDLPAAGTQTPPAADPSPPLPEGEPFGFQIDTGGTVRTSASDPAPPR